MKKLILVAAGALVTGSAVAALGMGASNADPSSAGGTMNVLGEPYYKAVAILHAEGIQTVFGGSVGSDVPQAQCIVSTQKYLNSGKMQLMLNCTKAAQPDRARGDLGGHRAHAPTQGTSDGGGARPTPGAPGVVTVTPTQVG